MTLRFPLSDCCRRRTRRPPFRGSFIHFIYPRYAPTERAGIESSQMRVPIDIAASMSIL